MSYLPIDLMTSERRAFRRLKVETDNQATVYSALSEVIEDLLPGEVIAISARATQTPAAEMAVAINWQDDL